MDKTLAAVLWAADDDLCVLVAAVARVVNERNYNQDGAQREMKEIMARLWDEVSGDEAAAHWRKPHLVRTG